MGMHRQYNQYPQDKIKTSPKNNSAKKQAAFPATKEDIFNATILTLGDRPIITADRKHYLIITDWQNEIANNIRRKIDIRIISNKPDPGSLNIKVFTQHKVNGIWLLIPTSPKYIHDIRKQIVYNLQYRN